MSTETVKLEEDFALEILDKARDGYSFEHDGHTYTQLTQQQFVAQGRWTITHMFVFQRGDGSMFGLPYYVGASDAQDDIEPFEYGAKLVPVRSRLVKEWLLA